MNNTILIADDEAPQRKVLGGFLEKQGFKVVTAATGAEAIQMVMSTSVDLVLTDYRMPEGTGLDVLRAVHGSKPDVPLILVTAFGTIEGAVEAIQEGAFDYTTKPINLKRLMETIHRALRHRQGSAQVEAVTGEVVLSEAFQHITSSSPAMQKTLAMASRAAASDATILVLGETGVGKEVVARAVHEGSSRRGGPFVAVNCGALAEGVLESELFGHEKGAFTGADSRHVGKLEEADGGSLFLDELGDITQALQIRLLRVLQEGEFQRVGGNDTVRTDARVIGATHRNLELLVEQGGFREDLYYRLNVISMTVPPLRERREDIPLLMAEFLAMFAQRNGKLIRTFSREASEALIQHTYPGNVRELENAIERAVVMTSEDEIRLEDLPESVRTTHLNRSPMTAPGSLPDQLDRMEKEAIIDALEKSDGVQSRAARLLGINERNLRYKLKKFGLK